MPGQAVGWTLPPEQRPGERRGSTFRREDPPSALWSSSLHVLRGDEKARLKTLDKNCIYTWVALNENEPPEYEPFSKRIGLK